MTKKTIRARVGNVLLKAATDPAFRKGLLTSPRSTLERILGEPLPERLRLKFIEKDPACDILFVLPDPVAPDELSPAALEAVAGGRSHTVYTDTPDCWLSE